MNTPMGDMEKWKRPDSSTAVFTVIPCHAELIVFKKAFNAATRIFELTKGFPSEERYALTDQIRRSSRSVCAQLAEAWRSRRDEKAFVKRLSNAEGEAAEVQVWLQFSLSCSYLDSRTAIAMHAAYDEVLAMLGDMIKHSKVWTSE